MTRTDIIGVTVGINTPYAPLASLAAQCFTKHTGIPAIVLGGSELADSGMGHPAALRLKLFDYVNTEQVVYFDSDWFCINDWAVQTIVGAPELLACRDFVLKDEWPRQSYSFQSADFLGDPVALQLDDSSDDLRHDYIREVQKFAGIRLPCAEWINTGLLVMNRKNHKAWLDAAMELYLGSVGHHDVYYEQPALVKAIESLGLRVRLLPRKYNVLAAYEEKWPTSVIGLHIKIKRHGEFVKRVIAGSINTPEDVESYFGAE